MKNIFSPVLQTHSAAAGEINSFWSGSETMVRPWMRSWKCRWTEYAVCELAVSHSVIWWRSGWSWRALSVNSLCFLLEHEGWVSVKWGFPWEEQQSPVGKDMPLPPKPWYWLLKLQGRRRCVKMSTSALTGQKHWQRVWWLIHFQRDTWKFAFNRAV